MALFSRVYCDYFKKNLYFLFIFKKLKINPSLEEIKLLEEKSDHLELMAPPDQFLYAYTRIYRYQAKLECLDFKLKYMTKKDDLLSLEKLKKCNQFCINLLQNNNINKVFSLILCIGNFMNQNNSKREASGFSIYNLNELLITIKSNESGNFNLLHYLVQTIKTKVDA
jgi:hypothetical protein